MTVPVGVVTLAAVSVTVAVQLVASLTNTVDGVQLTVVEVVSGEGPTDTSILTITPGELYEPK